MAAKDKCKCVCLKCQ